MTSDPPSPPEDARSARVARAALVPVPAQALAALRRRTTAVLVVSQILGGLGVTIGITVGTVLARRVGGSDALAGLAPTATVAGTALLSLPMAALTGARGRRPGLVLGYLVGGLGALVVVAAARAGNFPLLLCGMAAFGGASSANLQARFAAADLAEPRQRARAISHVVWATTVGAVVGPNIAAPAGRSVAGVGTPEEAGPFLWAAVTFLLCAGVVGVLLRPDPLLTARAYAPPEEVSAGTRSLRAGVAAAAASPRARLALVTVTVSHTAMVSVMAMTPVDLAHHGAGIELIGLVISGHIAGMYAFSPLMGRLADRVGRLSVIGLAAGLLAGALFLAGTAGGDHRQTAAGLFVLGLGWSAGLVAGSALLTDSVPTSARAAAQGLSDLVMNTSAGVGGIVAGLVVARAGYGWLNAGAACLLVPLAGLVLLGRVRRAGGADPETG
ncbi:MULTISPECIES: MFS transporter [unclassified Streptomyces]|uniref:MFS transporter n=1 Tax=unclassified Streptomyces TaxID=2593676 RepID=UPI0037F3E385